MIFEKASVLFKSDSFVWVTLMTSFRGIRLLLRRQNVFSDLQGSPAASRKTIPPTFRIAPSHLHRKAKEALKEVESLFSFIKKSALRNFKVDFRLSGFNCADLCGYTGKRFFKAADGFLLSEQFCHFGSSARSGLCAGDCDTENPQNLALFIAVLLAESDECVV